jgi:hypothetical protein
MIPLRFGVLDCNLHVMVANGIVGFLISFLGSWVLQPSLDEVEYILSLVFVMFFLGHFLFISVLLGA